MKKTWGGLLEGDNVVCGGGEGGLASLSHKTRACDLHKRVRLLLGQTLSSVLTQFLFIVFSLSAFQAAANKFKMNSIIVVSKGLKVKEL